MILENRKISCQCRNPKPGRPAVPSHLLTTQSRLLKVKKAFENTVNCRRLASSNQFYAIYVGTSKARSHDLKIEAMRESTHHVVTLCGRFPNCFLRNEVSGKWLRWLSSSSLCVMWRYGLSFDKFFVPLCSAWGLITHLVAVFVHCPCSAFCTPIFLYIICRQWWLLFSQKPSCSKLPTGTLLSVRCLWQCCNLFSFVVSFLPLVIPSFYVFYLIPSCDIWGSHSCSGMWRFVAVVPAFRMYFLFHFWRFCF